MTDHIDNLIAELDAAPAWPLPREKRARHAAYAGRAIRKGDVDTLRHMQAWPADRQLVVDPLGKRIAHGFADFLFADPVSLEVEDQAAQEQLDLFRTENDLDHKLHRMERVIVSEGEAWWKLHTDPSIAQTPIFTWNSRRDVVPLFYGDIVLACAFVTEKRRTVEPDDAPTPGEQVWRHFELHTTGRVVNVLYRGGSETLGVRVDLGSIPETAMLAEEWKHGLPMLAGRLVNDLDDDDTLGESEYQAVESLLFALNEAATIAVENARLTGQDRVFVAGRLRQADGSFDASLQVFEAETDGATLGEGGGSPPVVAVEKHYDADPLWTHIRELVKTILSRVGMVVQIVDSSEDGKAESGTAIRLRFLPTSLAAKGKRKEHEKHLPQIAARALMVVAKPTSEGGFGLTALDTTPPAVEFGDPIPRDESAEVQDRALAVTSGIMSRRQAITEAHPDWTTAQVDDELAEIHADEGQPVDPPPAPHEPPDPVDPPPVPA